MGVEVITLVCLGIVIVTGSLLNGLTVFVLVFDKTLSKHLSSVRYFLLGETASIFIVCSIGLPFLFANTLYSSIQNGAASATIAAASPFQTHVALCYVQQLTSYGMFYVSLWYQTIIALTRVAAIFTPHFYKQFIRQHCMAKVLLHFFPWLIGYGGYAFGSAARAYKTEPVAGSGVCAAVAYDSSPEAKARYASYLLADTFLHTATPLCIGLFCYVVIYARKFIVNWKRRKVAVQQQPPPYTSVTNNNAVSLQFVGGTATVSTTFHNMQQQQIERERKMRVLATVYVVNFVLYAPSVIAWGTNYFGTLSKNFPLIAQLLFIMYFLAFPINPVLYFWVSADFRRAFEKLWKGLMKKS